MLFRSLEFADLAIRRCLARQVACRLVTLTKKPPLNGGVLAQEWEGELYSVCPLADRLQEGEADTVAAAL